MNNYISIKQILDDILHHPLLRDVTPERAINYSFLNNCIEMVDDMGLKLKQLSEMEFSREQMYNELGMQIDRCINQEVHSDFGAIKLPESLPIEAYKNLFYNEKSEDWRLSFIKLDYSYKNSKLEEEITPAKRFSFLLGKNENHHTKRSYFL